MRRQRHPILGQHQQSVVEYWSNPRLFQKGTCQTALDMPSIDAGCSKNYRPVSNLAFISKSRERERKRGERDIEGRYREREIEREGERYRGESEMIEGEREIVSVYGCRKTE